jgi:thiol:disulfide interchange protein DsbC
MSIPMKKTPLLILAISLIPALTHAADTVDTSKLAGIAPGIELGEPASTPVEGLYRVRIGNQYAYLTKNGDYAFVGNLLDLKNGVNLTQQIKDRENRKRLAAFPEKDMIIFPAEGKQKGEVTVFSDTSCPYCRKLHQEIPEIQKSGISVRYIPFPRGMQKGKGYQQMVSVWCAEDRLRAMNIANGTLKADLEKRSCDAEKIIDAGYNLGLQTGVSGTPAVYLADGSKIGGYMPAEKLIEQVEKITRSNRGG